MSRILRSVAACAFGLALLGPGGLVAPTGADAQLLSPGKLARAHAEIEGIRNCTQCHELGQRGVAPDRCLGCHESLAARISDDRGYHATVDREGCADCHQEHLGEDFDLLRFDTDAFDHTVTGYTLVGSHGEVECRSCHVSGNIADPAVLAAKREHGAQDRTFLGLAANCSGCHQDENPHGTQFDPRTCDDCHDEGDWNRPPNFDHATTAFPLTGSHVEVGCADCHGADPANAVYRPLPHGACDDCHEDPHGGSMNDACASCHQTTAWLAVSAANVERNFDHNTTRFVLRGAHAGAACRACHVQGRAPNTSLIRMSYAPGTQGSPFPRPRFDSCAACHVEQHSDPSGTVRWSDCASCHSENGFRPTPFDLARHAESAFPLDGAHVVTPCVGCHQNPDRGQASFTLSVPDQECVDCHQVDDPHEGVYEGLACANCHVTDGFELALFDHGPVTTGPNARACASCHAADDPHQGQFAGRDCATCHVTDAFVIPAFDHSTTRFPLDGAHADAECASCHVPEGSPAFVRYVPLGTDCTDCHGELR